MTTKAPSSIKSAPPESLEGIAYASAATVPTVDSHDQDRLGYYLWLWLTRRRDPLDVVIKTAHARLLISVEEAQARIEDALKARGISV